MYRSIIKPALFKLSPEKAHNIIWAALKTWSYIPGLLPAVQAAYAIKDERLERKVGGISFKNPIGVAAGLDKDAQVVKQLAALGFGFIEIGTVTPKPQTGNPNPRLFRLPKDKALINRMGFNNLGAENARRNLENTHGIDVPIGGNIGKNKTTPNQEAVNDYIKCVQILDPVVDFFVINCSSPNTPGLRNLLEKENLQPLLAGIINANNRLLRPKPIFMKLSPDLDLRQINDLVEVSVTEGISALIATNTTINRDLLSISPATIQAIGAGGLSGEPLRKKSTDIIRYLCQDLGKPLPVVGVGGISEPEHAIEKINAGADLLQLYTGFIYSGPALVKNINKQLISSLD